MTKPADDFDQRERLAAGLLSFKCMSPTANARLHTDLRKIVTSATTATRLEKQNGGFELPLSFLF